MDAWGAILKEGDLDMSESLAEGILGEQKRARGLLVQYANIGQAGAVGLSVIQAALTDTELAIMEQDLPTMIRCFERLKNLK